MQQIVDIVEINWLDSWPETMQEEVRDKIDTVEVYEMLI